VNATKKRRKKKEVKNAMKMSILCEGNENVNTVKAMKMSTL
jgi:hypothetical protein